MEPGFIPKLLPRRVILCLVLLGVLMLSVYTLLTGNMADIPPVFQITDATAATLISVRQVNTGRRRHLEIPYSSNSRPNSRDPKSALKTAGNALLATDNQSSSAWIGKRHLDGRRTYGRVPPPPSGRLRSKVILLWTSFYDYWDYIPRGRSLPHCAVTDCVVTSDRRWFKKSDAVVFHARDINLSKLPAIRLAHQKWVFFCMESPSYSFFSGFHFMRGLFNWTMTYRQDSNIVLNYGDIVRTDGTARMPGGNGRYEDSTPQTEALFRKKKMAVWMVSHCHTASEREVYVRELQRYVTVDIIGACGRDLCPPGKTNECLKNFTQEYKFFLALENAICIDYVSEKFYRTLKFDMVPVVMGGANYSKIAPPMSYIDALSFKSPKHLADFLKKVASNFTLYSSYLQWKKNYHVSLDAKKECALCEKLHAKESDKPSVYEDFKDWWVHKSKCHSWRDAG